MSVLRVPVESATLIDIPAAEKAIVSLLIALGADITDPVLAQTPRRVVEAYREMLATHDFSATTFPNSDGYDEMVVVRAIPFRSLCAHHLLPFSGIAHVGYLPGERILGLSKLARAVELCARGFQVQERVTWQVAEWLQKNVDPVGVGVVLEAQHTCMTVRGIRAIGTWTTTSAMLGALRDDQGRHRDFLSAIDRPTPEWIGPTC